MNCARICLSPFQGAGVNLRTTMNRRQFLRTSALGATAFALAPRRALAASAATDDDIPHSALRTPHSKKPNLLFIMADQMRWDTLACYGNRITDVPALNKLASQSVIFDEAIVAHPVCTPSRGCMTSGLWPHQTGVTANNIALPQTVQCYPELLADPDYRTIQIGKWHLGDELFAQHGFQEWVSTEDKYEKHFSPGRDKHAKSDYYHFLADKGLKPDSGAYFSREFACRQPIENGKPAFQAMKAVEFLRRNKDNPFIMHVSYLEPHTPYISPLKDIYAKDPLPPPESYFKRHENPDGQAWRVRMRQDWFEHLPKFSGPPEKLATITRQYLGNVSVVDRSVNTILAELERLGLADNTIVMFTSDHGDMMGAHGLWYKEVMLQEAMRVPLLVRVPGMRGGTRISAPWSHVDLAPTILGLLGASSKIPADRHGRDRSAEIKGEAMPAQTVFSEWAPNSEEDDGGPGGSEKDKSKKDKSEKDKGGDKDKKASGKPEKKSKKDNPDSEKPKYAMADRDPSLRKYVNASNRCAIAPDGWKLTLSDVDIPELYNHRADPLEMRNLYHDAACRDIVKKLTAEIHEMQEKTGDTLTLAG